MLRKWRGGVGGGSKAVWNFSENLSHLVAPSFPKLWKQFKQFIGRCYLYLGVFV